MERDSCVMYRSFFDCAKGYDEATRLRIYEAIMNYMFYGIEYKGDDPAVNMAMVLAGPIIKKSIVKYENGKKGGRPKKNKDKPEKKDVANTSEKSSCRGSNKDSYGRNGNVKLSMNEYNTLVKSYCEEVVNYYIEKLDNWLNDKHNRNRLDHYAELNKFIKNGGGIIPIRAKTERRVANFADIGREKIDFKEFEEQFVENN